MPNFENPTQDDDSVDIDVSDLEEAFMHPKGDPAMKDAPARAGAESGLGRVIEPEALGKPEMQGEVAKGILDDLAENALHGDTELAEALEGKDGLKKDLAHLIRKKLAPELRNRLYTGEHSRVAMRASEGELRAFLAGEASKLMKTDKDIERLLKSDLRSRLWLERKKDEEMRGMGSGKGRRAA